MIYTKSITWNAPTAEIIDLLDRALLGFYAQARRNARRLLHIAAIALPLMTLLVGSCETSQLPSLYVTQANAADLGTTLFPDKVRATQTAEYRPAAGYIARAKALVTSRPQSLMSLTRQEIGYLFGTPSFRRHDADAEVLQYKTSSCVVDFYFYGQNKLSHIDVRTKEELIPGTPRRKTPVTPSEQSDCLQSAMKQDAFGPTHT